VFLRLLKKLLGIEPYDYSAWWERQQAKYQSDWQALDDKNLALQEAEDEYRYRTEELREISLRTVMLVTLGGIVLATCGFVLPGASMAAVVLAKLGAAATAIALILMLLAYMPRLGVLVKDFMSPQTWVSFTQTEFDLYVKYMMRTARKTRPLDRYKRFHAVAVRCLIAGITLVTVAFFLR